MFTAPWISINLYCISLFFPVYPLYISFLFPDFQLFLFFFTLFSFFLHFVFLFSLLPFVFFYCPSLHILSIADHSLLSLPLFFFPSHLSIVFLYSLSPFLLIPFPCPSFSSHSFFFFFLSFFFFFFPPPPPPLFLSPFCSIPWVFSLVPSSNPE